MWYLNTTHTVLPGVFRNGASAGTHDIDLNVASTAVSAMAAMNACSMPAPACAEAAMRTWGVAVRRERRSGSATSQAGGGEEGEAGE